MPGANQLSNEELLRIAGQKAPDTPATPASSLSNEELVSIAQGQPQRPPVTPQTVQPLPFVSDVGAIAGASGDPLAVRRFAQEPSEPPTLQGIVSRGFSAAGFDPTTDEQVAAQGLPGEGGLAGALGTTGQVLANIVKGGIRGPGEFTASVIDAAARSAATRDVGPLVQQVEELVKFLPQQVETVGTALGLERSDPQGEITGINPRTGLAVRRGIKPTEGEVAGARRELRERPEAPIFAALLGRGVGKKIAKEAKPKALPTPKPLRPVEPPTPEQKAVGEFFETQPKPLKPTVPEEVGSPIGKPTRSSEAFVKSLEASPGKLVNREQVIDHFRTAFKVPIRVGKIAQRKALGIFKPKSEVIRSKEANDINTISHEVGHSLEQKIFGGIGRKSKLKLSSVESRELLQIGKDLYGEIRPKGGFRSEGFAEYVNYWLTTEKANLVAPKFTKYFERTFLKENPEIAKSLFEGQKLIRRFREQGAVDRVFSNIDISGTKKPRNLKELIKEGTIRIRSLFEDDLLPLEMVERGIRGVKKLDPLKIRPTTSPTILARAVSRTASAKALQMVKHGTFNFAGKTTGISLTEALKPVSGSKKMYRDFLTYGYARRAIELYKRNINPGITFEDASFALNKLENKTFKKVFEDVGKFQDNVLEYGVSAGVLTKKAAETIRALNSEYIPLKRVFDEQVSGARTGGKNLSDLSSPLKRIKGSGRRIQDPLRSIIENTTSMIAIADKTRVGRALVELSETQGAGRFIEKVPAPVKAQSATLESMKKQLEDAGVDIAEADMSQVLTMYSNAGIPQGRTNVVSFVREGKREFFEVDKRLYGTLKALDDLNLPPVVDFFLGRPARAIRLGATGLNAGFGLITNPIRDAFTFGLQTEFTSGQPGLIAKGLVNRVQPTGKMNLLFKRSGADMAQFLGMDKRSMKRAMNEVLASDAKKKALNVVSHPIEAMKDLFSITEAGPRLAEFEAAFKAGEKKFGKGSSEASLIANLASSDVTINFRRAGAYGKYINQIIPFWNAQVQGLSKFARFAKENPIKAGVKGIATLTIPTIGIWMLNKDKEWYREMPAWQRYGFWNIESGVNEDGSPRIVRIPKPFEWGNVFAVAPEISMDYWYSKDKSIANDGLKYMAEQTLPIGPDFIPPSMKIPIELWANYDFFRERPIDPFFEVKNKDPEDRFSAYTTETAKFMGKQFGVSPRKIDHVVSSSTGGLGRDVIKAGEKVVGLAPVTGKNAANIPVLGRLFQRTQTPEKREQRIGFEKRDKEKEVRRLIVKGNIAKAKETAEIWDRNHPTAKIKRFRVLLGSAIGNEIRKVSKDQSLTPKERSAKIAKLRSILLENLRERK